MDLKAEIKDRVAQMLEIAPEEIGDDDLFTEHGMDSFIAMQLVLELESEYNITISDELITELKSVNDTVSLVNRLKN